MKDLLVIVLLLLSVNSFCQERSVKIYAQHVPYKAYYKPIAFNESESISKVNGILIGYQKVKEEKMRQFSIRPVYQNSREEENSYQLLGGDIRLDMAKQIGLKNKRADLYFGHSVWLGILNEQIDSRAFNAYGIRKDHLGITWALFSSFEYHLTPKCYVAIAANFFSWSFFYERQYIANPILSESRRIQTDLDLDLWGQRNFQIGFGYHLGSNNP